MPDVDVALARVGEVGVVEVDDVGAVRVGSPINGVALRSQLSFEIVSELFRFDVGEYACGGEFVKEPNDVVARPCRFVFAVVEAVLELLWCSCGNTDIDVRSVCTYA